MSKRDNTGHVPSTFERGPVEEAETIVAESVTVPEEEPTIPAQQSGDDVDETGTDNEEPKQKRFVKVTAFAKKNKKHIAIGALALTAVGVALKVIFSVDPAPETVEDVQHTPEVDGSVDDH
jgi:hypothetical protein